MSNDIKTVSSRRYKRRGAWIPYVFVGPFSIAFIVFMMVPLITAIWD